MALSRDLVLSTAIQILDRYGLSDLTMRRLASELHVAVSALYWHFPSKQSLLAALCDEILNQLPAPSPTRQSELVEWAVQLTQLLLSHPGGTEVVWSTISMQDWSVGIGQQLTDALQRLGLSSDTAPAASLGLMNLIFGQAFSIDQQRSVSRLLPSLKLDRPPVALGLSIACYLRGLELPR
ncbi:MAG: TetR family transcriptional regulator [Propionibacteriaceae bacterium]|jgi:AcrR family transcriptional regulator|nr:TetR family transcriptional regulator [Propionibacteriaceae bacterium]